MIALKITSDCKVKRINVDEPLHQTIRESLGGYLEIVHPNRLPSPYCMIADEEGVIKELPLNSIASYLYETDMHGIPIVGDIILMREKSTRDGVALVGLKERDINYLMNSLTNLINFFKQNQGFEWQEAL